MPDDDLWWGYSGAETYDISGGFGTIGNVGMQDWWETVGPEIQTPIPEAPTYPGMVISEGPAIGNDIADWSFIGADYGDPGFYGVNRATGAAKGALNSVKGVFGGLASAVSGLFDSVTGGGTSVDQYGRRYYTPKSGGLFSGSGSDKTLMMLLGGGLLLAAVMKAR